VSNLTLEVDELAEQVRSALETLGYRRFLHVTCSCDETTVVLGGRTISFHLKQVAQCVAAKTPGVERVVNHIEVVEPERKLL
jgi:osmotically-inducible protein OsmY